MGIKYKANNIGGITMGAGAGELQSHPPGERAFDVSLSHLQRLVSKKIMGIKYKANNIGGITMGAGAEELQSHPPGEQAVPGLIPDESPPPQWTFDVSLSRFQRLVSKKARMERDCDMGATNPSPTHHTTHSYKTIK